MLSLLPYFLSFLLPALAFLAVTPNGLTHWTGPVVVFLLFPAISGFIPARKKVAKDHIGFSLLLWAQVPIQIALVIYSLHEVSIRGLTFWQFLPLAVSVALSTGGIGITVAHELVHRASKVERGLGLGLLSIVNYMHYRIEHIYGHHKNVGTPEDPSSARANESIYLFWLRVLPMSVRSAWLIESGRMKSQGWKRLSIHNRMIHYFFVELVLNILAFGLWGEVAWEFYVTQSLIAVLALEAINYIEHYGLTRAHLPEGGFERIASKHSWDTENRFTNSMLFNLGMHSHHHLRPLVKYDALTPDEVAPKLPGGYSLMLLLALIPPLWKRVMGRRIP